MRGRATIRFALLLWCVTALAALRHSIGRPADRTDPEIDEMPHSASAAGSQGRLADTDRIVAQNIFSPSRQPMVTQSPEAATLTIVGVLMAPRPSAIIRGIPGYEASQILAPGDSLGEVLVLSVAADAVLARVRGDTVTLPFLRGER